MKILLNGKDHEIEGQQQISLPDLLSSLPLGDQPVLVERNGEAILAREIPDITVTDGDRIEIVRMVAGG